MFGGARPLSLVASLSFVRSAVRGEAFGSEENYVSRDRRVSAYTASVLWNADPSCDVTRDVTRDARRALREGDVTYRNDNRRSATAWLDHATEEYLYAEERRDGQRRGSCERQRCGLRRLR